MLPSGRSGIRLFRFAGIDVFLHWSWFIVAIIELQHRGRSYGSLFWNVAEYLSLFVIVLLHEFGHSLACRQVGGEADHIVLWPLGGVAYVNPPQRPGATLWSIAAGPLVNVVLAFPLTAMWLHARGEGWARTAPDVAGLIIAVFGVNLGILLLNLLPVYPLDGGQILRSLLWFVLGRARSLLAATIIGFGGVLLLGVGALWIAGRGGSFWPLFLVLFVAMNCWQGFQHARALLRVAKIPRRAGFSCPSCRSEPPAGAYWRCPACGNPIDTFDGQGVCQVCGAQLLETRCIDCGRQSPLREWVMTIAVPPPIR
jgi:Zn-dependent protease